MKLFLNWPPHFNYRISNNLCKSYNLFRDILSIINCVSIHMRWLKMLKTKVTDFMQSFRTTFPKFKFKPKFHYLLHYAQMIRDFGPIKHFDSYRFERRLKSLKDSIKSSKNYRNITFTLMKKFSINFMSNISSPRKYRIKKRTVCVQNLSDVYIQFLPNIYDKDFCLI